MPTRGNRKELKVNDGEGRRLKFFRDQSVGRNETMVIEIFCKNLPGRDAQAQRNHTSEPQSLSNNEQLFETKRVALSEEVTRRYHLQEHPHQDDMLTARDADMETKRDILSQFPCFGNHGPQLLPGPNQKCFCVCNPILNWSHMSLDAWLLQSSFNPFCCRIDQVFKQISFSVSFIPDFSSFFHVLVPQNFVNRFMIVPFILFSSVLVKHT